MIGKRDIHTDMDDNDMNSLIQNQTTTSMNMIENEGRNDHKFSTNTFEKSDTKPIVIYLSLKKNGDDQLSYHHKSSKKKFDALSMLKEENNENNSTIGFSSLISSKKINL